MSALESYETAEGLLVAHFGDHTLLEKIKKLTMKVGPLAEEQKVLQSMVTNKKGRAVRTYL